MKDDVTDNMFKEGFVTTRLCGSPEQVTMCACEGISICTKVRAARDAAFTQAAGGLWYQSFLTCVSRLRNRKNPQNKKRQIFTRKCELHCGEIVTTI